MDHFCYIAHHFDFTSKSSTVFVTLTAISLVIASNGANSARVKRSTNSWDSEEMSVPRRPKIAGEAVEPMEVTPTGFDLLLECEFSGNPTPQPLWLMDSIAVPKTYVIKTDLNKGSMSIEIPEEALDSKRNITCVASNFLGSAVKSFLITPVPFLSESMFSNQSQYAPLKTKDPWT